GVFIPLTDNTANDDPGYAFADHVEFRLPSLAAGATITFRFHVNVGSVTTPNFVNNFATVDSTETDPLTTNLAQTQIVVSSSITPPPVVNSPIFAGATSVSGTSTSPNGTVINVYVNDVFVGTTTVSGGTWTLNSIGPLNPGDEVKANATESGKTTSNYSASVFVSPLGQQTPYPVVNSPLYNGDTIITGTSISPNGTLIDVYVNGVYIG